MRRSAGFLIALCALGVSAPALAQSDISVIAITQPVSGCALTSTENVTIRVFNFGSTLPAGTSFIVSYTINAGAPVTELVTLASNLLSNSNLNYTFVTQANLSVPGSYTFDATCSLAGDVNPANDALTGYAVTNDAPSAGGTVSGPSSVCFSGNSGVLTLFGHTGSVLRWETSIDGGGTWTTVSNTTTAQAFNNLTVPTMYRAVVQNGPCAPATSSVLAIGIDPPTAGGTISGSTTVCAGSNAGTLTLTGKTGSVVRWETSIDGGITWINVANTTTTLAYTNLAVTTRYRALVQSGSCAAAHSSMATVTVGVSAGGAVQGGGSLCPPPNTGTLTLTGQTGSVLRWESSTNAGGSWTPIANTTATLPYADVTSTTLFRAVVQLGTCAPVFSSPATLTVGPDATITAPAFVCPRGPNLASVPDAGTGAIYFWSVSNGIITSGLGTRSITFDGVNDPVMLQALVLKGGCSATGLVTISVHSPSPPQPTISAPATAAPNQQGIVASVPQNAGSTYAWNVVNGSITGGQGTSSILITAGASGTMTLSVVETGANGCPSVGPGTATVQIQGAPIVATELHTLAPCRLVDTRALGGPLAGPALSPGTGRVFPVLAASCGIPASAVAIAANVTAVGATGAGTISLGAGDQPQAPGSVAFSVSQTRANNAIVRLATDGSGTIRASTDVAGSVHLVIDVTGWFE